MEKLSQNPEISKKNQEDQEIKEYQQLLHPVEKINETDHVPDSFPTASTLDLDPQTAISQYLDSRDLSPDALRAKINQEVNLYQQNKAIIDRFSQLSKELQNYLKEEKIDLLNLTDKKESDSFIAQDSEEEKKQVMAAIAGDLQIANQNDKELLSKILDQEIKKVEISNILEGLDESERSVGTIIKNIEEGKFFPENEKDVYLNLYKDRFEGDGGNNGEIKNILGEEPLTKLRQDLKDIPYIDSLRENDQESDLIVRIEDTEEILSSLEGQERTSLEQENRPLIKLRNSADEYLKAYSSGEENINQATNKFSDLLDESPDYVFYLNDKLGLERIPSITQMENESFPLKEKQSVALCQAETKHLIDQLIEVRQEIPVVAIEENRILNSLNHLFEKNHEYISFIINKHQGELPTEVSAKTLVNLSNETYEKLAQIIIQDMEEKDISFSDLTDYEYSLLAKKILEETGDFLDEKQKEKEANVLLITSAKIYADELITIPQEVEKELINKNFSNQAEEEIFTNNLARKISLEAENNFERSLTANSENVRKIMIEHRTDFPEEELGKEISSLSPESYKKLAKYILIEHYPEQAEKLDQSINYLATPKPIVAESQTEKPVEQVEVHDMPETILPEKQKKKGFFQKIKGILNKKIF